MLKVNFSGNRSGCGMGSVNTIKNINPLFRRDVKDRQTNILSHLLVWKIEDRYVHGRFPLKSSCNHLKIIFHNKTIQKQTRYS